MGPDQHSGSTGGVMADDEGTIPNPYLAALRAARARSVAPAHTLEHVLDKAVQAMESGAWTGGKADTFAAELTGRRTTVRHGGQQALQELDDAISGMPERVEPSSWYVHWHNLMGI